MWRSLVAHFVRDEGAAGSNPVIPIGTTKLVFLTGKIADKVNEIKDFRSFGELNTFISTLEDAFVIDENLSINSAVNILWNFRETDLTDIVKLSIPVSPYELDDGRQVLIISEYFSKYAASKGLKNS